MTAATLDLVLLVADLDQEQAMRALLRDRTPSLGIRSLTTEYLRHPRHDPGCFNECEEVLQPYQQRAKHALVLLDRQGSGREDLTAEEIEKNLAERLAESGWGTRSAAIAIDPELEIWVWSDSPKVDDALGWSGRTLPIRDWLRMKGLLESDQAKPRDPKRAFREALREVSQKPSASIFARLAQDVGLDRCQDPTFLRLRQRLADWFPAV